MQLAAKVAAANEIDTGAALRSLTTTTTTAAANKEITNAKYAHESVENQEKSLMKLRESSIIHS